VSTADPSTDGNAGLMTGSALAKRGLGLYVGKSEHFVPVRAVWRDQKASHLMLFAVT
jgi:hypothetical protein